MCGTLNVVARVRSTRVLSATVLLQGLLVCSAWAADTTPDAEAKEESLFEEDLDKRNDYTSGGDCRCDAVAAAVSLIYKF